MHRRQPAAADIINGGEEARGVVDQRHVFGVLGLRPRLRNPPRPARSYHAGTISFGILRNVFRMVLMEY